MNKKGFVASAVLYSLLLLFLALILGLLALLSNRKMILDRLKNDIKGNITKVKLYEKYDNGEVIYYNPVKGEICSDYSENNSKTGVKDGCLKWYIFNDTSNNDTVNLLLDHNITPLVPYNSTDNSEMKEVKTALESDTKDWKNEARLITAEEIAHITQADKILNWQLNKEYLSNATYEDNKISYFYFNGKEGTDKTWRTKLSTEKGKNSYAWLFDYTYNCTKSGCNIEDNEKYTIYNGTATNYVLGYWTSDGAYKRSDVSWSVHQNGILHIQDSTTNNYYGVRPVIKIEKSGLTTYSDGSIVYYNPVKGKRCIDYDENNSKTGVKEDCLKWYIFNDNKDNSSVNMLLDHNTTGSVVWSSIDNTEMKEVKTALENDTKNWVNKARLITVDEVAKITKADKILKFDSKKIFKRPVTDYEKEMSWFYFDGQGSTYEEWQTQVANKTAKSKYTWLFDNLKECTDYGCNKEGDNLGYWTSNAITGYTSTSVWYIYSHGMLGGGNSTVGTWNGVRPVIQIEKTKLTEKN